MEGKQHSYDWVALALGAWLFISPFFLSYASLTLPAAWNSYVVGAAVALLAASALWSPASKVGKWVNLVLGLWLLSAPFALSFYASEAAAAWNHIVLGVLIAGDSIWALAEWPSDGTHAHHQ